MANLRRNRYSLSEKYEAFTEKKSGIKPSKVAEKNVFPRNTVSS